MADQEVGQAAEPSEPKQSVPLPPFAGRDTPLTALTFRYSTVHMFVYTYVRMYVHTYVPMYVYVRMYGAYCVMHVRMYVCIYREFVCCVFDCQVFLPFPLAILDLTC